MCIMKKNRNEDTREPRKFRNHNFLMISEEFLKDQK